MNKIWRLFASDAKRLFGNVVTTITVLGLVALPSIFSWYNIIACWDVFGNTGNLTVAVANSDKGYTSDLAPLTINVGDKVTSALRANDQLDWKFTTEEDAIDGVSAGRYYAAVVIPESFSADMMSFYQKDVEHAHITYYSNQKKSAIAPKITDQGADQISNQVNHVFAETISNVALGLAHTMMDYTSSADMDSAVGKLVTHVHTLSTQMKDASSALNSYSGVISSAQLLVSNSNNLLAHMQDSARAVSGTAQEAQQAVNEASSALTQAQTTLNDAIASAKNDNMNLNTSLTEAFTSANEQSAAAAAKLREAADTAERHGYTQQATKMREAATALEEANATAQASRAAVQQQVDEMSTSLETAAQDYSGELQPILHTINSSITNALTRLNDTAWRIHDTSDNLAESTSTICARLAEATEKINAAAAEMNESATQIEELGNKLVNALNSGDINMLRTLLGSDPEALASAIAAPVQMERNAIFPVQNFGSAMAPLYTTLALWIGALLLLVTLRTTPSQRTLEEVGNPSSRQIFMGRFLIIGLISLVQSTVLGMGNLLFVGVQAVHPLLYMLCFWVAGLVFAFIIYTMVALFANLGKALGVVLLIVQVAGGGGSFPMQLLPPFFQTMSPYLPIAHAVRAMRAAMFGIYNNDFWIEIGALLLFIVPFALLGLVLHDPLSKVVPKFIERVEESKLM